MKVAVTTSSFAKFSGEPLERLKAAGLDVVLNPHGRKLTEDEAIDVLAGCDGVVAGVEPLTRRVLEALPGLKAIARCGVGLDSVDLQAAKERGIPVSITPGGPTLAVVELALAMALDLLRNVSLMDRELRAGTWRKRMGRTLAGKRLGVVGYGRIGRAVADAFAALNAEVAFYDPFVAEADRPRMELDELFAWADIATLHCSKPEGDGCLVGARQLELLGASGLLLNCARGGLVDEAALFEALSSGGIAGAGVDTFESEPYTGPLLALDNVVLTPHVGSYAMETRIDMELAAVDNLIQALGIAAGRPA